MITIDMPMPENCVECRFSQGEYGFCYAMPPNFCGYVNDFEKDGRTKWCPLKAQEPITGETNDGYHTFNELYHHRAVLFSVIVANYHDRAWKSKKHHDGTMYEDMFIVGIDTPAGQATYHYNINPYWDMFDCQVLDIAPAWDDHTPEQALERIRTLPRHNYSSIQSKRIPFILDGCDISFSAEAPADMTLAELLKQCDRIKPDWCACGIGSYDLELGYPQIELSFDYDDVQKIDKDAPCTIRPKETKNE